MPRRKVYSNQMCFGFGEAGKGQFQPSASWHGNYNSLCMKGKDLVFIVEDNVVQQKMLKAHFEEVLNNYSVRTFSSPIDLIKNLKDKPFAVVLDHFFDPGTKTGLHYLRELKKRYSSIPIIYHTILDDDAVRAEVMALGASEYIIKDTTSLVRLRTTLDTIHNKIIHKKEFFSRWCVEFFGA